MNRQRTLPVGFASHPTQARRFSAHASGWMRGYAARRPVRPGSRVRCDRSAAHIVTNLAHYVSQRYVVSITALRGARSAPTSATIGSASLGWSGGRAQGKAVQGRTRTSIYAAPRTARTVRISRPEFGPTMGGPLLNLVKHPSKRVDRNAVPKCVTLCVTLCRKGHGVRNAVRKSSRCGSSLPACMRGSSRRRFACRTASTAAPIAGPCGRVGRDAESGA